MSLDTDLPPSTSPPVRMALAGIFAAETAKPSFWSGFGLSLAADGQYRLPEHVIGLEAIGMDAGEALTDFLKTMGVPPRIAVRTGERQLMLFRVTDTDAYNALQQVVPAALRFVQPGQSLDMPNAEDWQPNEHSAHVTADLSELTLSDIARLGMQQPDPVVSSNPLLQFSLRGQSEKFRKLAVEARPLLGEVCLRGQVTIWYAAPGTGKTLVALSLLLDAVREDRIAGGNVFYVNADDNGKGFATKLQIMDDIGANTLAPGFKGFRAPELIALLHKMADRDESRGVLVIVDTIKKFASLMDKRESSDFAHACRRVAMMGGTVLGLAHTTKNRNSDGTPRYAGTSDLVDDADAAYVLALMDAGGLFSEKIVEFRCFKSRGDSAEAAAYAFAAEKGVSYEEKLASVRPVDPLQVDTFQRVEAERQDAEIVDAIAACIGEGIDTKMLLTKEVAARASISGRAAGRVIERYTGEDPALHRWRFERGERGVQRFKLLPRPDPDPAPS